jgi:hypothetical protein
VGIGSFWLFKELQESIFSVSSGTQTSSPGSQVKRRYPTVKRGRVLSFISLSYPTVERGRAPPHVPVSLRPSTPILRNTTPPPGNRLPIASRDPRRNLKGNPSNGETDFPSRPCVLRRACVQRAVRTAPHVLYCINAITL